MFDSGKRPHGCGSGPEAVSYLYGELCDEDRRQFEDHLSDCTECAEELAAFAQVRISLAELGDLSVVDVRGRSGYFARYMEVIAAGFRQLSPGLGAAAAVALIIVLAVFLGIFSGLGSNKQTAGGKDSGKGNAGVEQNGAVQEAAPETAQREKALSNNDRPTGEVAQSEPDQVTEPSGRSASGNRSGRKPIRRSGPRPVTDDRMAENQEAPRLSEAADEDFDDDSLRLTDLFAGVSKED